MVRDELAPHRVRILVALAASAIGGGATAVQAWLVQPALDKVFLERDPVMLLVVPLSILAAVLIRAGAGYIEDIQLSRIGQDVVGDLQKRLFARLVRDEFAYIRDRGTGALLSHLTYDVTLLRQTVSNVFTGFIRDSLTLVCLVVLMLFQDAMLALLAAMAFPVATVPLMRMGGKVRQLTLAAQEQMGRLTARLERSFEAIRQVKADGQEARESAAVAAMIDRFKEVQLAAARYRALASPSVEIVTGLMIGLVILYGGWQVLSDHTTPGRFFSFLTAMLMAYQPMKRLAKLHTMMHEGLSAASRIYALLDRPHAQCEMKTLPAARIARGGIQFRKVSFSYGSHRVFHDFDLEIEPGSHWVVTGPSGCGKSTLLDLLLRFHEVECGSIFIDGFDLRDIDQVQLRRSFAFVGQDTWLFDDTIAANIAYACPTASEDTIRAAARHARIDEVIERLPDGYATRLGAGGIHLSGGQRQRLSLARAMLKDSPVMLLDEATSALDATTEAQVIEQIQTIRHSRTTIFATHRAAISFPNGNHLRLTI
ncbi:MAG: ABC transporter ATP-binding protein [Geminicoccaceae bacterium]|nr:ABC transporter ATP-binding protein [Geminicoccaceae bacterium]